MFYNKGKSKAQIIRQALGLEVFALQILLNFLAELLRSLNISRSQRKLLLETDMTLQRTINTCVSVNYSAKQMY